VIAVIYARYSSDLQREASIEDQIRLCRERIEQEGWGYLHAYTDRALSGASALRPAYQSLLEDARRGGQFDVVVAEALDRLSRDQEDVAGLFKRLRFAGVRLFTLAEGEITELHVGLKGTMNALFLKDLADKTRRGLEGRVREGRSGGGLCFGYDVVREHDARGEPIHGKRKINEAEAVIVRRIFAEFAAGKSPRRIAVDLNRDRIPGPRGGEWDASTINGNAARGTGILNNELYIGRLVWNRLRYVKDPATGKRISRLNEPHRWVVHEVPELRVIPQDLWDAVKARHELLKRDTRPDLVERPFWARQRPRFLITGLAKCGACGSSYVKISANLFGCAAARNRGTCSNRLNIRLDTLEQMILDGLRHQLMAPDLFKAFCEEFHREVNRLRSNGAAEVQSQRSELDRVAPDPPHRRGDHRGRCAGPRAEAGAGRARGVPAHVTAGTRHNGCTGAADPPEHGRGLPATGRAAKRGPAGPGDARRSVRAHPLVDRRDPPRARERRAAGRAAGRTRRHPGPGG
jgi:site-specific DNA recombinase